MFAFEHIDHSKTMTKKLEMETGAMNQVVRDMAREWAKDHIRINAVAPWIIWTPLAEAVILNSCILLRKKILGALPLAGVEPFKKKKK